MSRSHRARSRLPCSCPRVLHANLRPAVQLTSARLPDAEGMWAQRTFWPVCHVDRNFCASSQPKVAYATSRCPRVTLTMHRVCEHATCLEAASSNPHIPCGMISAPLPPPLMQVGTCDGGDLTWQSVYSNLRIFERNLNTLNET